MNREQKLEAVLKELLGWCAAWSVPFLDDEEWPETEKKIHAALADE